MTRILVVDDTPQNIALIELYLRGTEFEVVAATSGREAIEQSMRRSFDLILLDVVMPGIDGFEVCRRLKNDPSTAFVPVIFLTGRIGDESEKLAAYQLGAVDYIQKPVDREELVARIRVMLRLEGARSRLDRENAELRAQLGRVEQRLIDMAASYGDIQHLDEQRAALRPPMLLLLDAELRVKSFDPGLPGVLPELALGRDLAHCGPAAAVLADAVGNGTPDQGLALPTTGDCAVELSVGVRRIESGEVLVLLQDLTGVREAERRLARALRVEPQPLVRTSGYRMTDFVGSAKAVLELSAKVDRLRQTRSTVLIYGESGTGKELVARALHFDGQHRARPFIPLHCGAIAPELIESELFGHEKGSFTGAQQAHEGMFSAADGGTIFLDEIAETTPSLQVKLLRVLQRGEIRPVGANQPRIVDVRIIAATNRDLLELVQEGKFRQDLFHRLDVVTLHLPPLRDRITDLPQLAEHFLMAANRRYDRLDRPVRGFAKGAMERLAAHSWPGNVRELEHVIEGAFALGVGETLREADLPVRILRGSPGLRPSPVHRASGWDASAGADTVREPQLDLHSSRDAAEREAIARALQSTGGDKIAAAHLLGMARSTFYRRCKKLGL